MGDSFVQRLGACTYGGCEEARKRGFRPPLRETEQTRNERR